MKKRYMLLYSSRSTSGVLFIILTSCYMQQVDMQYCAVVASYDPDM